MTERQQIEREVLAITIGPRPIVDALVDLILENRAAEAEHCTVNFNATNAGPGMRRARELRALKGATKRAERSRE